MIKLKYSPQLDGLRAVCIIFTIFNHIEGVPFFINGSVGVDVFFSLSGFLITGILLESEWRDVRGYYLRRFFRIAPVYYLSLFLTVFLALVSYHFHLGDSKLEQVREIIVPSILFSRELSGAPTLFGQAWTVGVEEKFYFLWPVIFLLLRGDKLRVLFLFVFVVTLMCVGSGVALRGYGGIAVGCAAAILLFRKGVFIRSHCAVAMLCMAYVFCLVEEGWFGHLLVSTAAALLVSSLYSSKSIYSDFLSRPAIVFLGKLTFSVYMFHVVVLYGVKKISANLGGERWWLVFIGGYVATILISWFVYHFYEYPLIHYGKSMSSAREGRYDVTPCAGAFAEAKRRSRSTRPTATGSRENASS